MSANPLRRLRSNSFKAIAPSPVIDSQPYQAYNAIYTKNQTRLTNFEEYIKTKLDEATSTTKTTSKATICLTDRVQYRRKITNSKRKILTQIPYVPATESPSPDMQMFRRNLKPIEVMSKRKIGSDVTSCVLPIGNTSPSESNLRESSPKKIIEPQKSVPSLEDFYNRKASLPTNFTTETDLLSPKKSTKEYQKANLKYTLSIKPRMEGAFKHSSTSPREGLEQLQNQEFNGFRIEEAGFFKSDVQDTSLHFSKKEDALMTSPDESPNSNQVIVTQNLDNKAKALANALKYGDKSSRSRRFAPVRRNSLTETETVEQKRFYNQLKLKLKKFSPPKKLAASTSRPTLNESPSPKKLSPEKVPDAGKTRRQSITEISHWLESRKDFGESKKKHLEEKNMEIITICSTLEQRTRSDVKVVGEWLRNIKFFSFLPFSLHKVIGEKLQYRFYQAGDILCEAGEYGDCLYIIYEGLVRCIVNGSEVAKYRKYDALGQSALHGARIRTATLVAGAPTHIFTLEADEYLKIMEHFVTQQKEEIALFLQGIGIFRWLDVLQMTKLANLIQTKQYVAGEHVYTEGDNAESFYILKRGLLKVETTLTIEKRNLWPVDAHLWMKSKLERKTKFADFVHPKEYFGEIELIKNCKRLNSVICLEDSQLLILNKIEFFECLGAPMLHEFLSISRDNFGDNPEAMRLKLLKQEDKRKKMINIMSQNWGNQLRGLDGRQAEKRNKRVIEPILKKLEGDLKSFIKETTAKTLKTEVFTNSNYDT